MLLAAHRMGGIELAVDQAVEEQPGGGAIAHPLSPARPSRRRQAAASRSRARASRDITVPVGASIAAAISR